MLIELTVPIEMIAIPGGSFSMGASSNAEECPQHEITVQPFYLSKYPITLEQWRVIAARTDLRRRQDLPLFLDVVRDDEDEDFSNHPVVGVKWRDAVEFCDRLSILTGKAYRLPNEAEWEYACNDHKIINPDAAFFFEREQTLPVGYFHNPNAFGLHDMLGNVWEWCADRWHDNYNGAPTDGSAWVEGGNSSRDFDHRVLKGEKSATARGSSACTDELIGFRIAC